MNMLSDSKIVTPEKSIGKNVSLPLQERSLGDNSEEDISTVFRDLHVSAFKKAASISPIVTNVTLGKHSADKSPNDSFQEDDENSQPLILQSSTPDKSKSGSFPNKKALEIKQRVENLSPIGVEKITALENIFSTQKLLNECDVQRRLTVDKVMRERIQNMYDTGKLIRDSLEHLKQTRQEEALARRLLLERKILDDIHEQEILNKPKREAQWAKDNLKEAQRIQERNQRVKEAEEEARKKSESALKRRKQIDQILVYLQKEYNQQYKNLWESIKLCKDKAALTDFTALQSKSLKECTGTCEKILKKCRQEEVNEEDVESAKKLVETFKSIQEAFSKEIIRINEQVNNKKEESEKKPEPPKDSPSKSAPAAISETGSCTGLIHSVMIESHHQRRSLLQSTGQKNAVESKPSLVTPGSLKRKSQRAVSHPLKKKSQISESHEEGIRIDHSKNVSKNKLTTSSAGFLKAQRKSLSNNSDAYDKGDVQRLRNKSSNTLRKKLKRVRFSDSTEIIDSNYISAALSGFPAHLRGTTLLPEPSGTKAPLNTVTSGLFQEPSSHNKAKYLSDCFDARSLETYLNLKALLENCEKNIEPLLSDDSMKKFRFGCQKAVNIPVNAISPVSGPHLYDKYLKLHNLLSGRPVEVGDIKISATQHSLGILYCKYLLAKKFVRQGDLTVSSKPDAAFSIAAVLASLWVDFPDFGQLVLAHFQSACPYLAPVFMPQVEKQSDEEYHRSLGYHYSQNGEVEKQDSFLKRMSGIMRLYSALLISSCRQPGKMNPLGLSEGWRWISALLNLEPRPDICATLLYDFLEVAGHEMFRAYGGQFKKMLAYICQEYFPKLEKVTPSGAGGPMVRLEGFLQKVLKDESIPSPHGVLPPNFWSDRPEGVASHRT